MNFISNQVILRTVYIEHIAFSYQPIQHMSGRVVLCVCVAYVLLALDACILRLSVRLGSTHFAAFLFVAAGRNLE